MVQTSEGQLSEAFSFLFRTCIYVSNEHAEALALSVGQDDAPIVVRSQERLTHRLESLDL
jgi:hypothetical protein